MNCCGISATSLNLSAIVYNVYTPTLEPDTYLAPEAETGETDPRGNYRITVNVALCLGLCVHIKFLHSAYFRPMHIPYSLIERQCRVA
jgi:hypothetical protein